MTEEHGELEGQINCHEVGISINSRCELVSGQTIVGISKRANTRKLYFSDLNRLHVAKT